MSAVIIRPECWRQRYVPSKAELIYVAPVLGALSWRVWWWSAKYELGLELGNPHATRTAAEAEAVRWADIYSCPWKYSPAPINSKGEMVR